MDYNILINGIIHQLFIQNTYMPDDDTLTILNKYFNNTSFTITAFRLTSDNDSDNYQRELSNLIPKYAKRHCSYPVWFYRTEDYNNLLRGIIRMCEQVAASGNTLILYSA